MARVTVEDCLKVIPNRFELVLLAAKRARQLTHGQVTTLPMDNDKFTVIALREIESGVLDIKELRAEFAKPVQEEEEEEEVEPGIVEVEARALLVEATAMPIGDISGDSDSDDSEDEKEEEEEEEEEEIDESDDLEDDVVGDIDLEDEEDSFAPANDFPAGSDFDGDDL